MIPNVTRKENICFSFRANKAFFVCKLIRSIHDLGVGFKLYEEFEQSMIYYRNSKCIMVSFILFFYHGTIRNKYKMVKRTISTEYLYY